MEKALSTEEIAVKFSDYREIVAGFSDLLGVENQALRDYDVEKVGQLHEQKVKIVSAYRSIVGFFIKNQNLLQEVSEEERLQLKELSQKLNDLMEENEMLLKTKMQTNQAVMDSFVKIARVSTAANSTSYSAGGKYSPVDSTQSALTVNRTL